MKLFATLSCLMGVQEMEGGFNMTSPGENEFIIMLKEYKEDFYRLAYSYVKNEQDALDVIGEATYKAFNALDKLKEKQYMKSWFCRILINESNNILRKKKVTLYDTEFIETISQVTMDQDELMDLYRSLDRLPEKYKSIITLKYMNGMQISEIAKVLALNNNTVKTRLRRGVDRLKKLMGGDIT